MAVVVAQMHKKRVKSFTKDDLESEVMAKSFTLFALCAPCDDKHMQHSEMFIFFLTQCSVNAAVKCRKIMEMPSLFILFSINTTKFIKYLSY